MAIKRANTINDVTRRYLRLAVEDLDDAVTELEKKQIDPGTPVNAASASKVLTVSGLPTSGHTVTVGETVYTWRTALTDDPETVANEVLIGEDAEGCIDNLVLAINYDSESEGFNFSAGTVANESVTAEKASASTMKVTAITPGADGNSIALAENDTNTTWASGATHLSGGVDATEGLAGQLLFDDDNLYICLDDNSIVDSNWKKVSLSSL